MRERRWRKPVRRISVVKQTKKDLTSYALTKVLELQDLGDISFTRATDDNHILRAIVPVDFALPCKFEKGWARRLGVGNGMYGEKYIRQFRVDIEEQFQLGEISSNAKSSPAKILEYLQKKYPEELCLPSESDIRAEISRLMAIKRKKEAEAAAAKKSGPKEQVTASTPSQPILVKAKGKEPTKKRDNCQYQSFIQELAALEIPIMPKEAVKRVLERFPRSEHTDLPIYQKIYESFSYQKGKRTTAKKVMLNNDTHIMIGS